MKKIFYAAIILTVLFSACPEPEENDGNGAGNGDNGNTCTITFDSQGGDPNPAPQTVTKGGVVIEPDTDPIMVTGEVFLGWYKSLADGRPPYDWNSPVEESFKLYAKWNIDMVTITFNSADNEGVLTSEEIKVIKGRTIETKGELNNLYNKFERRDGYIFGGWLTGSDKGPVVTFPAIYNANTALYANWIDLEDVKGAWTSTNSTGGVLNLLVRDDDEDTGYIFEQTSASPYVKFGTVTWELNPIAVGAEENTVTLELDGKTVLLTPITETKIPETDPEENFPALAGFWVNSSVGSINLRKDGTALITDTGNVKTDMVYAADEDNVYLLCKDEPYCVLMTVKLIGDNSLQGFNKLIFSELLLGIWEIDMGGKKASFEFSDLTEGNYYALGKSLEFNYVLNESTEDDLLRITISQLETPTKFGPYRFEISGNTLTLNGKDITALSYKKLGAKPVYTGAAGDPRLFGQWNNIDNDEYLSIDQGLSLQGYGFFNRHKGITHLQRYLYQASDDIITFYPPDIGIAPGIESYPYTVTTGFPAALTFNGNTYQQSAFVPTSLPDGAN